MKISDESTFLSLLPIYQMPFFQKTASSTSSSSSSSLPSSPSSSSKETSGNSGKFVNNCDPRRLTRQKKLRHVTCQQLGLQFTDDLNSPPASPDSDRKPRSPGCSDHWFWSAVPHPLPLPELTLTKTPELFGSNFGQRPPGSPPAEVPSSVLWRNSADHIVTVSATCSSNHHSQDANFPCINYDLRLNISARSAPTSGFSSPMVSPRRSNAGELSPPCNATDSTKGSSNCCKGQSHDINIESVNYKLSRIASPKSAPTSSFSSPAVSPQRSNTGDFLPSFVASKAIKNSSALEIPDLGRLAGYTSQVSPVKIVHSTDCSPFHSPSLQSPHRNPRRPNKFSFPSHTKLLPGRSKEWPESNNHVSAHPLPLPPGAAPPQSFMPSSPAIPHHTIEKPNLSLRKTQWLKGKLIGRGTYGSVYVGTNRETGALCAIKEVDIIPDDSKSAECIKQLEQEIRLLQHLKHPNIVQYYGSEIVEDHFYIYLEYVHPGSINRYAHEHCGDMTESIVRNFTRHILSGLAYLHGTKTIHRDIKGANLLVDSSGIVKLADFGMAKHLTGLSYELSLKGSPHWMAPEVIKAVMQKDADPHLALAVDIWSLGCTIIEMFTGKPPWGDLQGPQAMFKVLNKTPPIPEAMSPEGKDFLCCCFRRNPAERPSASILLEHPFVQNSGELNVLACRQALSAIHLMDKSHNVRDSAAQKIDLMPVSSGMRITSDKLPSNSETCQQIYAFNCAATSHHCPCSPLEVFPGTSTRQLVYGSHNFSSSSNVSSNMPLSASNNHPLALSRCHGREVPHI